MFYSSFHSDSWVILLQNTWQSGVYIKFVVRSSNHPITWYLKFQFASVLLCSNKGIHVHVQFQVDILGIEYYWVSWTSYTSDLNHVWYTICSGFKSRPNYTKHILRAVYFIIEPLLNLNKLIRSKWRYTGCA